MVLNNNTLNTRSCQINLFYKIRDGIFIPVRPHNVTIELVLLDRNNIITGRDF